MSLGIYNFFLFPLIYRSNSPDQIIFFELVNGQTQPTNKEATFTLESEGNVAYLKLDTDKTLDYESVSEYTLTIRASVSHYS